MEKVTRTRAGTKEYLTEDGGHWDTDPNKAKLMSEDIAKATANGLHMTAIGQKWNEGERFIYGTE